MLRQRVVTALVIAPIGVAAILFMPPQYIWYLLAVMLGLAAWEWVQFAGIGDSTVRAASALVVACIVALALSRSSKEVAFVVSALAYLGWFLAALWLRHRQFGSRGTYGERVFKLIVGAIIFISCALAMGHLFVRPQGRFWLMMLLLVIWAADTGAYFFGRRYGKRKLAPAVSPGKTWEGVFGGLLTVGAVTAIAGYLFGLNPGALIGLVLVALGTAIISIIGDLLASLLKRQVGLKDSGRLLPGHGGVIDRFDSLMAAAPAFYLGIAWLRI